MFDFCIGIDRFKVHSNHIICATDGLFRLTLQNLTYEVDCLPFDISRRAVRTIEFLNMHQSAYPFDRVGCLNVSEIFIWASRSDCLTRQGHRVRGQRCSSVKLFRARMPRFQVQSYGTNSPS